MHGQPACASLGPPLSRAFPPLLLHRLLISTFMSFLYLPTCPCLPLLFVVSPFSPFPHLSPPSCPVPPPSPSLFHQACFDKGAAASLGLSKMIAPVSNCRSVTKKDMKGNSATPDIRVDPETYAVTADGQPLTCKPAASLPLAQNYFLF